MAFKNKTTQTLAIPTSGRKKAKGIGFEGVKVPQKWLLPAADSTQPFAPVIDQEAFARWNFSYLGNQFIKLTATVIPTFLGGVLLAGITDGILLDITGWGIAGVAAAAGTLGGARADRIAGNRRKAVARYADAALKDWLFARYNLKIERVISNPQGSDFLLRPQLIGVSMIFVDEQERSFKLIHGTTGLYVEEYRADTDYAPSGTVAAVAPLNKSQSEDLESLLTGDAQPLHERTSELLATLDKRTLSTEGQHVVKRVREDLRQTLVINRELQELGGADENSRAELAAVISALNDELDEVLMSELRSVRDMLSTQLGYVRGRRRALGSGLQLAPKVIEPVASEVEPAEA